MEEDNTTEIGLLNTYYMNLTPKDHRIRALYRQLCGYITQYFFMRDRYRSADPIGFEYYKLYLEKGTDWTELQVAKNLKGQKYFGGEF